jgi:hypothetical protein
MKVGCARWMLEAPVICLDYRLLRLLSMPVTQHHRLGSPSNHSTATAAHMT